MSQGDSWLQHFLEDAVRRKLCTRIHCTTCGAMEFRKGLLHELQKASGLSPSTALPTETGLTIARALAQVRRPDTNEAEVNAAVRLVLFEIWSTLKPWGADTDLDEILQRTWAGSILAGMRAHAAGRDAARRAHAESEAGAEKRREEKKRLKQEQHAKRLTAKVERDRLWREKQKENGK